MNKILVINSVSEISEQITNIILQIDKNIQLSYFVSAEGALEFLNYELPQITIINFADPELDNQYLLKKINDDQWLHYGGIIAIHKESNENEFLKQFSNSNIISIIHKNQLKYRLAHSIKIILKNNNFIFQREFQQDLITSINGVFTLENDPFEVNIYANIISNYLFNTNLITFKDRHHVKIALSEILMNAIEHGNCDINFEEKTEFLLSGGTIFDLINKKKKNKNIANKKVTFEFKIMPDKSIYIITDEGNGFDWKNIKKKINETKEPLPHGRGIFMTTMSIKKLSYNDKGNEATLEILHQKNHTNLMPKIFEQADAISFSKGEKIFTYGEESNFLYYIISGELNVYDKKNRIINSLSPKDIFVGEMSFLLNDKRTASVRAKTDGQLTRVSKKAFIEAIKNRPYYALFLARLLAGRVEKMNRVITSFKKRK